MGFWDDAKKKADQARKGLTKGAKETANTAEKAAKKTAEGVEKGAKAAASAAEKGWDKTKDFAKDTKTTTQHAGGAFAKLVSGDAPIWQRFPWLALIYSGAFALGVVLAAFGTNSTDIQQGVERFACTVVTEPGASWPCTCSYSVCEAGYPSECAGVTPNRNSCGLSSEPEAFSCPNAGSIFGVIPPVLDSFSTTASVLLVESNDYLQSLNTDYFVLPWFAKLKSNESTRFNLCFSSNQRLPGVAGILADPLRGFACGNLPTNLLKFNSAGIGSGEFLLQMDMRRKLTNPMEENLCAVKNIFNLEQTNPACKLNTCTISSVHLTALPVPVNCSLEKPTDCLQALVDAFSQVMADALSGGQEANQGSNSGEELGLGNSGVEVSDGEDQDSIGGEELAGESDSNQPGEELAVGSPTLTVSQATLCRKGPGSEYAAIGDLQVGEQTAVVGLYADGDFYVIENYGVGGTCWIYGGYATTHGSVSSLPYWDAPAPPVVQEPEESSGDAGEESAGPQSSSLTFTFQNLLSNAYVSELYISPEGSSSWGGNLISGEICEGSSQQITMPNNGSSYDLKVVIATGGGCSASELGGLDTYYEYGVPISNGSNYPFKPY